MVMDPVGVVILVSATVAQPAIQLGIDPLHFWIVCLVAFELGYLSPPVALNHLLTRQVVGETEVLAAERTGSFWHRYQRLLRSEERRVGKECRSWWSRAPYKTGWCDCR